MISGWVSPRSALAAARDWQPCLSGSTRERRFPMTYKVESAAVIGAGVMGAGIAAHLANVGIPTLLLDIVPTDAQGSSDHAARSRIAATGIERQLKAKPAPGFYAPRSAALVTSGNIEDDLPKLAGVDLIIEAVFERLDIKRDLYTKIEPV